jgi:hypothetical protein
VRTVAVALLLVMAACSDSSSTSTRPVIATSSTTAEEARAIDGPVMRYQDSSSTSAALATLLDGVLQLEGSCLYLVQESRDQRFPIVWPADTRWDAQNQSVVTPDGIVMPMGKPVEGRGGYFFLSDVNLLVGAAASNLARQCLDNDQTVVFQNVSTAVGPKA